MSFAIPDELVDAFKEKKCGIFVGAGASLSAGLPDWAGLLKELVSRMRKVPNPESGLIKDLTSLLKDKSKQLMLASVLKDELGQEFSKYIESRFADRALNPSPTHRAIVSLPSQFLITTNYDALLERAILEKSKGKEIPIVYTYKQAGEVASCLHRNKVFVLKAHGDAQLAPDEVILTEKDYRRVVHHEPGYQSLLQTLFTTFTILFIGTSFTDIELKLLLGYIHSSFHGKTPAHYAVIPELKVNAALTKSWRRDFNINEIHVSPKNNCVEVLEFLAALKKKVT